MRFGRYKKDEQEGDGDDDGYDACEPAMNREKSMYEIMMPRTDGSVRRDGSSEERTLNQDSYQGEQDF